MKRWMITVCALTMVVPQVFADAVMDDFDAGFTGATWPNHHGDYSAAPGEGVGGSGGVDYAGTGGNHGALYKDPIAAEVGAGNTIKVAAWIKFSVTDTLLNDTSTNIVGGVTNINVNGVNQQFFSLRFHTSSNWWDGGSVSMGICRRDDAAQRALGTPIPAAPWINGWISYPSVGLPSPLGTAGTSDWFMLEFVLTDNGATYDHALNIYAPDGVTLLHTTGSFGTSIASGTPLYAGFWNGWYPAGASLLEMAKVDDLKADNFVFGTPTVRAESVGFEDVTGYSFLSQTGKTHRLQYRTLTTTFTDTGASVAGDGTVKVLYDPAPDTSGRTYRVTID